MDKKTLKTTPAVKKTDNVIFILWGEHFDEAIAAIFATRLRQAGLCVKMVGLAGQRPSGKNGLALYPDITMSEALVIADQAVCVVLPCSAATLRHAEADPRIIDFFQKSYMNAARFVTANTDSIQNTHLEKILTRNESLSTYGTINNAILFADELARALSTVYGV